MIWMPKADVTLKEVQCSGSGVAVIWYDTQGRALIRFSAGRYSAWTCQKTTLFSGHYLVTVQLWIWVFWVISVYFNIRNTLPNLCPFLPGHSVYRWEFTWNQNSNTLEYDRPQRDRSTVCYCPTAFFRRHLPITLSVPAVKNLRPFP
jgi:hypothetical protein